MLRNCACLVIAHMVDATQLCLSCHCTHGNAPNHSVAATKPSSRRKPQRCTHQQIVREGDPWMYGSRRRRKSVEEWVQTIEASLQKCGALQNAILQASACPPSSKADRYVTTILWRNMFGRFCSEWTCGRSCLKHWANWPKKQTICYKIEKKTSFFRRRLLIRTNSIVYSFLKTRTHGKNGTKSTYEPTNHTWNSTPSQHFVHLQPNAMLISLRVAITAVTMFTHPLTHQDYHAPEPKSKSRFCPIFPTRQASRANKMSSPLKRYPFFTWWICQPWHKRSKTTGFPKQLGVAVAPRFWWRFL